MLCGKGRKMKRAMKPNAKSYWSWAFAAYGCLSLSSMAGMGIGSGLFALASLAYFAAEWRGEGKAIAREAFLSPYSVFALLLFAASLISLLAAIAFPVEGSQEAVRLASLKKFHYFLLPPLVAAALLHVAPGQRLEEQKFWKVWAVMGALLGVVAMVQFFGDFLFTPEQLNSRFFRSVGRTDRYHGQGFMFFHLSFASCMCFVAAAGWARVVFPLAKDSLRNRALWALVGLLGSLGVYYSYSRIAFVALAFLILALFYLRRPRWGLVATLVVGLLGAGVWASSESLRKRFEYGLAGIKERTVMWRAAEDMFLDRPLTGVGFSRTGEISPYYKKKFVYDATTDFTSHAHNNFLDMLGAVGALGFAAFLGWWGFLFYASGRAFKRAPLEERWLPAAAIAGFLAFHVNGLTQVNFWDGKSQHTLMIWAGVALALWVRDRKRTKEI